MIREELGNLISAGNVTPYTIGTSLRNANITLVDTIKIVQDTQAIINTRKIQLENTINQAIEVQINNASETSEAVSIQAKTTIEGSESINEGKEKEFRPEETPKNKNNT